MARKRKAKGMLEHAKEHKAEKKHRRMSRRGGKKAKK